MNVCLLVMNDSILLYMMLTKLMTAKQVEQRRVESIASWRIQWRSGTQLLLELGLASHHRATRVLKDQHLQ